MNVRYVGNQSVADGRGRGIIDKPDTSFVAIIQVSFRCDSG
jgi:hypothetical protein